MGRFIRLGLGGALLLAFVVAYTAVARTDTPSLEQPVWSAAELDLIGSFSPLPGLPASPSNRFADDARAARFGHEVFFDTGFSVDGSIGCVTCHKPSMYFTDGQPLAVGLGKLTRHTPTIMGTQWGAFQFWDGRKDSLWSQALAPFEGSAELGISRLHVAHRVFSEYAQEYTAIFGPLPALDNLARFPVAGMPLPEDPEHPWARAWAAMQAEDRDAVNRVFSNVGKAIAAYERKLTPRAAAFDHYVEGLQAGDMDGAGHLSLEAQRGLQAFIGKAGCFNCHNGPLFSDGSFHSVGLEPLPNETELDMGRSVGARQLLADPFNSAGDYSDSGALKDLSFLDPEFEDFRGAFKTPTLRNIAATGPYGHNGQFAELEHVIDWYRKLPRVPLAGHRDLILKVLPDAVMTGDLVAFLESLTGELPDPVWLQAP